MSALVSTFEPGDGDVFARIAAAVEKQGYVILDHALPPDLVDRLFIRVSRLGGEELSRAGIGREDEYQLNRFVRSDETCWLDACDPVDGEFLDWMEGLRLGVNRRLFLGLFDYEAHYARYRPGAFYRRHRDAFADDRTNRVLSTVLYLNPGWGVGDGGEMVLYADDGDRVLESVQPGYGRLAVFLSESFPHEVLPATRNRLSIAGWFRVNPSTSRIADPGR